MTVETIFIQQEPYGEETYLGDGLYASFNGNMIKLRAPRGEGDHEVFLEPSVWHALVNFAKGKMR